MQRARDIFRSHTGAAKGEFTHNRIIVPHTDEIAKDLLWFMERYPLDLADRDYRELRIHAERYDSMLAAAAANLASIEFTKEALAFNEEITLDPHQITFVALQQVVRRILLADKMGLGKTFSAAATLAEPDHRPAIVVAPTHLGTQWAKEVVRLLPGIRAHVIKTKRPTFIPPADVYITAYSRIGDSQDILAKLEPKTLIFDEVQDLRHQNTAKRFVAKTLSQAEPVANVIGLSGTPIYNMGAEIWSVMDVIAPGELGSFESFRREWVSSDMKVRDPAALNSWLISRGLMLRRTPEDIGQKYSDVTRNVITLDADLQELQKIRDVAKLLAQSVLSNVVGRSEKAARELDWKLRQATGIAKALPVAELVKMLAGEGEKVLLTGWHRDVYSVWLRELKLLNPVMYTGTESPAQKAKTVAAFTEGDSQVFILSLRSGAGLDGLQRVCSCVVFGELDWSPHVMDQIIGRLDRPGQEHPVRAFFPVIDDGSDPFMLSIIGEKRNQHTGLIEGKERDAEILEDTAPGVDRMRGMAQAYLESIGEKVPEGPVRTGLIAEIVAALRRIRLSFSSEAEMQSAVWNVLPGMLTVDSGRKEYPLSERSRLDFLFTRGAERIAIECKTKQTNRAEVYRQVRRYAEEAKITGLVLYAPWSGVADFEVDGIPITVVDWSKAQL